MLGSQEAVWVGHSYGLNRFGPHKLTCLDAWPTGSGLLGGVALLEEICPCWGKCVTVRVGFEVSYAHALPRMK